MNKTDIGEIKRRLKKDKCMPRKITGCCVSTNKEILATFQTFFGNVEEVDQVKYLEIASKVLGGKVNNNNLELSFPLEEEAEGGCQYDLLRVRDCDFDDEDVMNRFYKKIVDSYTSMTEYVIFLYHDIYDVMDKTTDGIKVDESTSTYNYLVCAICPLEPAKPGLIYSHSEQMIKARIQDWVITEPEIGFVFPAFTDRDTDIHSVLYHVKNTDNTQDNFVKNVLGCDRIQTSDDKKEVFAQIITETFAEDENANPGRILYDITESLKDMIEVKTDVQDPETGMVTGSKTEKNDMEVSEVIIKAALEENEVPEEKIEIIKQAFNEGIKGTTSVDEIVDRKLLNREKAQRREEELIAEIVSLKEEIRKLNERIRELEKK